jgi:Tol biopolymer transport system component
MFWRRSAFGAVITLCSVVIGYGSQDEIARPAQQELIAEKDATTPPVDPEDVVSRDGRRVSWRAKRGGKWIVLLNSQPQGTEFDEIRALRFSADGQQLAYAGKRDQKWMMVVNAKEQSSSYDDVGEAFFSEDGDHVAFAAKRGKKWIAVVDGVEQAAAFDEIEFAVFSSDGRRLAYAGRRGRDWTIVIDGKEGPFFHVIGGLVFWPQRDRFVYSAVHLGGSPWKPKAEGRVVIEDQEGPLFEGKRRVFARPIEKNERGYFERLAFSAVGVSVPIVSPDGRHMAYVARRGENDVVVTLNEQAGPSFESILDEPVFSLNGEHIAYVAQDNETVRLVIDGVPTGKPLQDSFVLGWWESLAVSPDGRHVAHVEAGERAADLAWLLTINEMVRKRVFLNGQLMKEYKQLSDYVGLDRVMFSPDSRHLIYEVHMRDDEFVAIDGREGDHYDQVLHGSLRFLDDHTVTYVARTGRQLFRITQAPPRLRDSDSSNKEVIGE